MRTIIILMSLLFSGCAAGNANLYEGELWVRKHNNIEQTISVDQDEIFTITIYFK